MPTLDSLVLQPVKNFSQRVTPILSIIQQATLAVANTSLTFMRKLNPTLNNVVQAYEQSPDLAHIVKTTARHTAKYILPIMGVKMFVNPMIERLPVVSTVFLVTEESVFIGLAVYMFASTILYNLALTKALEPHLPARDETTPKCDCGVEKKIAANLANSILYSGILGAASVLNALSTPTSVTLGLRAMAYGYAIGGMQYSIQGDCATHYSAALNQHKVYYLSIGAMLIYVVNNTNAKISEITGVANNYYLEDAIFNLLWQQAIIVVTLQANAPDYMDSVRQFIGNNLIERFKKFLDNSQPSDKRDYIKRFNQFLATPTGQLVIKAEPVELALDLHRKELNVSLEWIAWLSESEIAGLVTATIRNLPKMFTNGQSRALANILKQQDWSQTKDYFRNLILDIEARREMKELTPRIELLEKDVEKKNYVSPRLLAQAAPSSPLRKGGGLKLFDVKEGAAEQMHDNASPSPTGSEEGVKIEKPRDDRGHEIVIGGVASISGSKEVSLLRRRA